MTAARSLPLRLDDRSLVLAQKDVLYVFNRRGAFDLRGKGIEVLHARLAPHLQGTHGEEALLAAVSPAASGPLLSYFDKLRQAGALRTDAAPAGDSARPLDGSDWPAGGAGSSGEGIVSRSPWMDPGRLPGRRAPRGSSSCSPRMPAAGSGSCGHQAGGWGIRPASSRRPRRRPSARRACGAAPPMPAGCWGAASMSNAGNGRSSSSSRHTPESCAAGSCWTRRGPSMGSDAPDQLVLEERRNRSAPGGREPRRTPVLRAGDAADGTRPGHRPQASPARLPGAGRPGNAEPGERPRWPPARGVSWRSSSSSGRPGGAPPATELQWTEVDLLAARSPIRRCAVCRASSGCGGEFCRHAARSRATAPPASSTVRTAPFRSCPPGP